MSAQIEWLLFDWGNVLVEYRPGGVFELARALATEPMDGLAKVDGRGNAAQRMGGDRCGQDGLHHQRPTGATYRSAAVGPDFTTSFVSLQNHKLVTAENAGSAR